MREILLSYIGDIFTIYVNRWRAQMLRCAHVELTYTVDDKDTPYTTLYLPTLLELLSFAA
jgi:hypothetical protein